MKIAVLTEQAEGERRVALVPESVGRLSKAGHRLSVQANAGDLAGFPQSDFQAAGAETAGDISTAIRDADLLPCVNPPAPDAIAALKKGAVVTGLLRPGGNAELLETLASQGITAFSMELVPRIARAQRMDVLSSQSSLAGYKAVLIAADTLGKFMPMMMTAAGTIPPARVLVIGAGVAGLQAIATARRLGAIVEVFDVRAATKEQVESLGATFVEVPAASDTETAGGYAKELSEADQSRQREVIADHAKNADVVITTALIPDRPAPLLITASAVAAMRPGSVIVDLAAEAGGNCELSEPGRTVNREAVLIHAPLNVPSMMPLHASQLYSRNIHALIDLLTAEDGALSLDFSDEIVRSTCVTHDGRVVLGDQDSLAPSGAGTE